MKKNPYFWFIAFIIIISIISDYSYVIEDMQLNPNDYARITDVEYKAVVVDEPYSEGTVMITERLTFDVHAASQDNLFWELWRDLPEDNVDGLDVTYKVHSVKQILDDGTEIYYDESPKLYWDDYDYVNTNPTYGPGKWFHSEGPYDESAEQYECLFFYVDGLYREEVVFEIEYEMHNAALRYNDCSDLYLSLYSGTTIKHLNSFKAEILFPDEDMPGDGNYDVYTYGTNSNEFPVTESASINPGYYTFSFELDEEELQFRPYNQYIEFDLVAHGEDKHIFTEFAPSNYYSNEDVLEEIYAEQKDYAEAPERYKKSKLFVFIASIAGALIILVRSFTTCSRMRSKNVFYKPSEEITYFRDIPSDLDPNFAAALVFCKDEPPKDTSGVYSAILLSLARKKYIELNEYTEDDVQIIIKKYYSPLIEQLATSDTDLSTVFKIRYSPENTYDSMKDTYTSHIGTSEPTIDNTVEPNDETDDYEPLTPCEEYYFNLIARHAIGNTILMSTLQSRVTSDYENTDAFATNIENSIVNIGIKDGYFQKADYAQPKNILKSTAKILFRTGLLTIILANIISYQTRLELAYGAFFIVGISCIISSIYLKKESGKYVLLTQFGENEYAKWRGLYNFLNSETLIHERTVLELALWEKYLVYATAFGLSDKIINALNIRCPENDPSTNSSHILDNPYYRSRRFHYSGRRFHSSVRSGSYSARSGGGGGGFGYGGGGRGGGGGGGGH